MRCSVIRGPCRAGAYVAWLEESTRLFAIPLVGTFGVLLFPTGRLPSRRWRPAAWLAVAMFAGLLVRFAFGTQDDFPFLENPFAPPGSTVLQIANGFEVAYLLLPLSLIVCAASLVWRWRASSGDERQQVRWVSAGAAIVALAFVLCLIVSAVNPDRASDVVVIPEFLATMLLSAATAVAILMYRLYDLDLVINRAAVYALLSAALIAVYVGAVALLGDLLGDPGVLAAGAVAVAVHPLRLRTQRAVNRTMYGDRDDPYLALARLGDRLAATIAPDAVAETVVDTVAEALRVSNVDIELVGKDGFVSIASRGARTETGRYDAAIVHRGEPIGRLIVHPGAGRELSSADRRLLDALAGHVGAPLFAVRLTNELQHSRKQLIEAREEERRRIRRDLHDGLGPTLAGMGFQIDSIQWVLENDGPAGVRGLGELRDQVRAALADVQRLVYDLRPPALDDLGLLTALREHAARISAAPGGSDSSVPRLDVRVDGPEELPPLPAAVEIAAYRIALEAMTNVARHAGAQHCTVEIAINGGFELIVTDDGRGFPAQIVAGVGLSSMRERAAELGGTCTIEPSEQGGIRVCARLPLMLETS